MLCYSPTTSLKSISGNTSLIDTLVERAELVKSLELSINLSAWGEVKSSGQIVNFSEIKLIPLYSVEILGLRSWKYVLQEFRFRANQAVQGGFKKLDNFSFAEFYFCFGLDIPQIDHKVGNNFRQIGDGTWIEEMTGVIKAIVTALLLINKKSLIFLISN